MDRMVSRKRSEVTRYVVRSARSGVMVKMKRMVAGPGSPYRPWSARCNFNDFIVVAILAIHTTVSWLDIPARSILRISRLKIFYTMIIVKVGTLMQLRTREVDSYECRSKNANVSKRSVSE